MKRQTNGRSTIGNDAADDGRRDGRPGPDRPGRRAHLRLSRRRGAADLRRDLPAGQGPATSSSATSRAPATPPRAMPARPARPGVALVTSGPGATNMVTPLTDALMDSIPIVCITGQVPTHLIGNDAFQECDTVGITRPCTKHNWLVRDVNDLAARHPRGLLRRHPRPARAGAGRHPEGRAVRHRHLHAARSTSSTRPTIRASRATRGRSAPRSS